ncbi:MAG: phosphocholine cytidylyltransferase family protein [Lachnospiraceae bacterium]|nr:phosphocholine cytidylyltransferase family protein [Lachnospiraceae bacterium]
MKALILAAGFGKRLQPITNTIPKSMVEVNGTPLLVNALNNLTELGITDIGIVVGHMANYIKDNIGYSWNGAKINYFENPRYIETNNIYSLYKAVDYFDDDLLMLECDIYYHKDMIEKLMEGQGECSILVSPFNPQTMDGTVIRVNGDKAEELILGKWQNEGFDYSQTRKTVNMYRFTKEFVSKYIPLIKWYVENMGENSYYEKVLGSLIYLKENDIRIVEVPEDMWCEVDDADDLNRARERFGY